MNSSRESPDLPLEHYRPYLMLLARTQLGRQFQGKLDASDVVQQALLEAHRQRQQFQGGTTAQLLTWLRRILAGTLTDALRALGRAKRDAKREHSLEAALDQSSDRLEAWVAADQTSPSEAANRKEQLTRVAQALETLPEAQRTALVLRYCQGLSIAEISTQIDRSPTAVAGLLKRGTKQLRELLQDGS